MRLTYYVFLSIAIIFMAISNAAPAVLESEQTDNSVLTAEIKGLTCLLASDYDSNTRSLRANTNNDDDNLSPADEERTAAELSGRFNKMLSAMTQTSSAINNIPAKTLNGLFITMEKIKVTCMKLQKYFKITGSSGGRCTFFKKFEAFWNTKYSVAA